MDATGFNRLERAVLDAISEHYAIEGLSDQLTQAVLIKREWTKVGFYVEIGVPRSLPRLTLPPDFGRSVNGPMIMSDDIHHDASTLVWVESGYCHMLEMFAYGDWFNEHVDSFELVWPAPYKPGLIPRLVASFRRVFGDS